jgi:hypothetical protein
MAAIGMLFRRQSAGQIVGSEINLHFLLLPEFLTEAAHGRG